MILDVNIDNVPYYPDTYVYNTYEDNNTHANNIATKVRIKRNNKWYNVLALQSYELPEPSSRQLYHKVQLYLDKISILHREVYNIIHRYIIQEDDIKNLDVLQIDERTRLFIIDNFAKGLPSYYPDRDLNYYKGLHQNRPTV